MTRFVAIVAVLVSGCGGAQAPAEVVPQRMTATGADVIKVADDPEPAPSRDDIESEYLARLREQFARDPLAVIDVVRADYTGSDEDIAKKLYFRWKAAHPEPAPAVHAPTQAPPVTPFTVEGGVKVLAVDHTYWCYALKDRNLDFNLCASTRQLCEVYRVPLHEKGVAGSACVEAPSAACYLTHEVVSGANAGWCASTFAGCNAFRTTMQSDDRTTSGECVVMRYRR